MKLQLLKENLQRAAALAARFTSSKAQLPILGQVGIEARKEGVFFWATDLEAGVRVRVGGKVLEMGEVAVPAKMLAELAGALPLGAVELETNSEGLRLRAGSVEATIASMPLTDFPKFGEVGGLAALESVPLLDLEKLVDRVVFALSTDESRPILTGMLWELKKGTAVATDGYRMSLLEKALPPVRGEVEKMVVGGELMREVVRAFGELGEKEARFAYEQEKQRLLVMGEDILMMGRVLGGEFPDYKAILPAELETVMVFDREELVRGMRTASIFARESANIVKLALHEGQATLSANAPQVGSNTVGVQVEMQKPGEGVIAFNSKYVIEALSHMDTPKVVFGMSGPLRPGVWMEEGNDHFRHVIMPVRVRGEGE